MPRALVLGFFVLTLSSCLTRKMVKDFNFTGKTMGTYYRVKHSGDVEFEKIKKIKVDIEKHLHHINALMSTYIRTSQITQFNKNQSTNRFSVHPDFFKVLKASILVSEKSKGAFDITVMPLVNLWGFGPQNKKKVPTEGEIQAVLNYVGNDKVVLDADKNTIKKKHPKTEIDLSASAKGYAVDFLAERLSADYGLNNILVEIGGEVRAIGKKRDGKFYKIGIESPKKKLGEQIQLVVKLDNRAIATSGNYRNYFESKGKIYSHTINSKTGRPVERDVISATVISKNCLEADAWATALVAAGSVNGYNLTRKYNLLAYFIVKGEKEPKILVSPEMNKFLKKYWVK
jgi:thiamine biosynthesis lipoprotein